MATQTRINMARKFGGDKSYYGEDTAFQKGPHAAFPASIPKYSLGNTYEDAVETAFRLWLPAAHLLKTNPQDRDILIPLIRGRYIDLIATDIREGFAERVELKKLVNGAFVTYYYGSEAPNLMISGHVLNDFQADWRNNLLRLYTRYLRGTKLAKRGRQVIISYSDRVMTGEIVSLDEGLTGSGESHGNFTFRVIVHKVAVKVNPIVSDFKAKEKSPFTGQDNPSIDVTRKSQAVIRSNNAADVITQGTFSPGEIAQKRSALNQQYNNLNASLVNAKTRQSLANQALDTYKKNNGDIYSAEGLSYQLQKDAADLDVGELSKAISDNRSKLKSLESGTILKDGKVRARSAKKTTPSRVIEVGKNKKPPVNRRVQQRSG